MRMPVRLMLIVLALAFGLLLSFNQPASAQQDDPAAQQLLVMINGWRIQQGLWPLRENPILDQMAFDQASYILSLPTIPNEAHIHLDANGDNPAQRAKLPQYNWPSYGDQAFTAIGEIAYVGYSAQTAYTFWNNSPIHHDTALNPAYREIGVAALRHPLGHLYFVDFGARPDVLPVIADQQDHLLYLSNERYLGAKTPWIGNALQVRLFDADGRPLGTGWQAWQAQLPIPPDAGNEVIVAFEDGSSVMVLSPVSLAQQVAVVPTSTPTLVPTTTSTSTSTPTATLPFAPNVISGAATSTAVQTPVPPPTSASPDNVLLLYDSHSFALINLSQRPINVQPLVFAGAANSTFAVTKWATQWLSGSLAALAGGDCLQMWSWLETSTPAKPSRCRTVRSVLTIAPDKLFWKQGDFAVQSGTTTLATCHLADSQCSFSLPAA